MEPVDINFQFMYYHPQNSKGVAFNLLRFGWEQFCRVDRIRRADDFREMCYSESRPDIDRPDFAEFNFNTLTDSIRISICIENYFKACLLCEGYVVHKLDCNDPILKGLSKEQYKRPIKLDEVKNLVPWGISPGLKRRGKGFEFQMNGVQEKTIGMRELLKPPYRQVGKMPDDVSLICSEFKTYRNRLHLYVQENIKISKTEFHNLSRIIEFFNLNLVHLHNKLSSDLSKDRSYDLRPLEYPK